MKFIKGSRDNNRHIPKIEQRTKPDTNQLVSVIIPSYNRYDSLLHSIKSIKEQTHRRFEIIVINDGSDDKRYNSLSDLGVKHIKIDHTGLHMVAMNVGIRESNGQYIAFLDDDDGWDKTKIEKQLKCLRQSNCKMSSTNAKVGTEFYSYDQDHSTHIYFTEKLPNILSKSILEKTNYCMNSSVIIEKSLLYKTGLFYEHPLARHAADYTLWLRILDYTNCIYLEEPLIYYRDNRTSSSMRYGHGGDSCETVNRQIQELVTQTGKPFPQCLNCQAPIL